MFKKLFIAATFFVIATTRLFLGIKRIVRAVQRIILAAKRLVRAMKHFVYSICLRMENFAERKPWQFAFLSAPLIVTTLAILFPPAYETGDDVAMQLLASGKANVIAPDEHLVFTHPFIGLALKIAYSVVPQLPWYGLYLMSSHVLAHGVVAGIMLTRNRLRVAAPWFTVWMLSFGLCVLTRLQFTTTAFLAGLSGFLLIWEGLKGLFARQATQGAETLESISDPRFCKRLIVLGVLCMWWCEMIRSNSFILCIALMMPTLGLWVLTRRVGWKSYVAVAGLAGVIVVGGVGLYKVHVNYYYADPEWVGFFEFNELRAKFNDHRIVRFSPEKQQIFFDAGWTMNDVQLLRSWCFDDQRVYSAEVMNKILASHDWYGDRYSLGLIGDSIGEIASDNYARCFAAILVVLLVVFRKNRSMLLLTACAAATSLGIIVMVTIFQKTPPPRVYNALIFWPVVVASWTAFRHRHEMAKKPAPGIEERISAGNILRLLVSNSAPRTFLPIHSPRIVLATLSLVVIYHIYLSYDYSRMRLAQSIEFKAHMKSWNFSPENLYVTWGASLQYSRLSPFDNCMWLKDLRTIPLGWQQTSPTNRRMAQRFGMKNVLAEMHAHPEVRVVNSYFAQRYYSRYAFEHDGASVTFTQLGKIADSKVASMESSKLKEVAMEKSDLKR